MARILLSLLLLTSFGFSAFAGDKTLDSWEKILADKTIIKSPTAEETREQAIPPSPTGEYQLYTLADKFVFLFDPQGSPLVAFDLTQDHVGFWKGLLGGIGIGDFSLWRVFNRLKKSETEEETAVILDEADEAQDFKLSAEAMKSGYDYFAKLEFKEAWAREHGYTGPMENGKASGFKPATFTLFDLAVPKKEEEKINPAMAELSRAIYGEALQGDDLESFKKQFRMIWSPEKEIFNVEFDATLAKSKRLPIPDWTLNYINPLDNLAYKYYLKSIENTLASVEFLLGNYAKVFGVVAGKMLNSLKQRADAHESHLMGLLEAASKGEYEVTVPLLKKKAFLEKSIDMLYLSKMIKSRDITNGPAKRKQILEEEKVASTANLKWLVKNKYKFEILSDTRFVRATKDGKDWFIYNIAIKRHWLTRKPHKHFSSANPNFKTVSRLSWEVVAAAVRYMAPRSVFFGKWLNSWLGLSISVYLPGALWDRVFQASKFVEVPYEGELLGLIHEQLNGRYNKLAMSNEDLTTLQFYLYRQRQNPFDFRLKEEAAYMERNLKRIEALLSSGFNPNALVMPHAK